MIIKIQLMKPKVITSKIINKWCGEKHYDRIVFTGTEGLHLLNKSKKLANISNEKLTSQMLLRVSCAD